jgi:hypothetical protein
MSCHHWFAPVVLWLLACGPAVVDEKDEVQLEQRYCLDLRARQPAEKEFTRDSPSFGVHVFHDRKPGCLLYVAAQGKALAVVPAAKDAVADGDKGPQRLHRLLLPVRGWDDKAFGEMKVSVEVYRDEHNGNLIYLSHTGCIAVVPNVKTDPDMLAKEPKWLDRFRLKVRPSGENDFTFDYIKCNVEVYRDEYTGCLVYVEGNGALAVVVPAKAGRGKETAEPKWEHAVGSRVRAYGEEEFAPKTAHWSAEVYLGDDRGIRIYANDKQQLAAVVGGQAKNPNKIQGVEWEKRILPKEAKDGGKWSAELFSNPNTDDRLFVTANGALAVIGSRN